MVSKPNSGRRVSPLRSTNYASKPWIPSCLVGQPCLSQSRGVAEIAEIVRVTFGEIRQGSPSQSINSKSAGASASWLKSWDVALQSYKAHCKIGDMKNPHAVALGKLGGEARTANMTPEQRREWARLGGLARAERHTREELSRWSRMGGRPRSKASARLRGVDFTGVQQVGPA